MKRSCVRQDLQRVGVARLHSHSGAMSGEGEIAKDEL